MKLRWFDYMAIGVGIGGAIFSALASNWSAMVWATGYAIMALGAGIANDNARTMLAVFESHQKGNTK